MLNSQRSFVDTLKKYCAARGITVDIKSEGWFIIMQRGAMRRFAFGYDLGLNSSVAHRIASDKAATSEVLAHGGVACVPHALFLNPELNRYVAARGTWEAMLALLAQHPAGVVVKPNEGTSGRLVFRVRSKPDLELAVKRIFSLDQSIAISPYLIIDDEVRVVLIDDAAQLVYGKNRACVLGDGKHSLLETALAALPAEQLSAVLPGMINDLDRATLDTVLPAGQRQALNWRHNLDAGAAPVLLPEGAARDACVALATAAARSIGLRFASVDLIRADGAWRVLEVNSGVMMEALNRLHPDLVEATYTAALDKVFGEDDRPGGHGSLHQRPFNTYL
jgi:glutathione synthase/RimK-type ligase-like ATP-grasp enzyme